MNPIFGIKECLGDCREQPAEADSAMLAKCMREEAVAMRPDGRGELRLNQRVLDGLRTVAREGESLRSSCIDAGTALNRLLQDVRMMQACASQARKEAVRGLPAAEGTTRIECVVRRLCGTGEVRLTEERLLLGIASFDDVQALSMSELWAVPEAVRVCLSVAYLKAAKAVLEIGREKKIAERWVDGADVQLAKRHPAFFEHAFQLLSEREEPDRLEELEKHLASAERLGSEVIHAAHEREAVLRMRLENLMAGKRLIDSLDWEKCFEKLSSVEQELNYDPAGVYSAMEADSREVVRKSVSQLAQKLELGELTVARHAVRAAQAAAEAQAPEAHRTVCYWLYDDAGRTQLVRRMGGSGAGLRRLVPDPTGRKSVAAIAILFASMYALYLLMVRDIWFVMMGIPLAWGAAMALLGRAFSFIFRPAKLLKLKVDTIPDSMRTLVVMPVLLSSKERAKAVCDQFEALGCMEKDRNIRYLILGDFSDSDEQHMPEDDGIVSCVQNRIKKMNDRAGFRRYYYLHRPRQLLRADNRWMGRDRKRGALMDLNRLILGENGAEEAFSAQDADAQEIRKGFRYVLTIDADTRFLPGTVQRLVGAIAHPLNAIREEQGVRKGYAVIQPQMEMTASVCVNEFVKLFAGSGGLNTYPSSVSNFWQDVTGTGLFGGKGIYDVRAFSRALEGGLPEGRILSHDLIEGTLAGAALASDICFYDGFPSTLIGFMRRLNRWTRGDWQLLPIMLGAKKYPVRESRLSAAERLRMLDNLLHSLWAPSLLGLLIQSVWMGHSDALAMGLLLAYWSPILNCFSGDRLKWRRATAELSILPVTAACMADAILRTLWRIFFSGKHLLEWVPSAEAEKTTDNQKLAGRVSAILLVPGIFVPGWALASLALGALFLTGAGWVKDMEEPKHVKLSAEDEQWLRGLAEDTWKFFEEYVTEEGNHLPPDNVQVDPDVGAARRTSPTNIGLYLMSCVSALELDLIDREECLRRVNATVRTLARLGKWRGHLYNWYDIDNLCPLNPKYVSSVDSGNLAASLLLCASALSDAAVSSEMICLVRDMDFSALYDGERELFHIGADVQSGQLSLSHYDLLASESRILSFTAMMLGSIPIRHWSRLGRTAAATECGAALASWSGTMFEYLMPQLYMHAPENTLLGDSMRTAIAVQQRTGERSKRPWGVSEAGYYAFDLSLNYQYRAFGMPTLALGGQSSGDVVAPYASLLALFAAPEAVLSNVRRMETLGWRGEFGMYESADYTHADEGPRIVKSYMAHHQGMALCAMCNALTGEALNHAFHTIPEARALELLLEERMINNTKFESAEVIAGYEQMNAASLRMVRAANNTARIADAHLLGGSGATALVTADGAVHYMKDGVQATRFAGDVINREDGACVHARRERTGECAAIAQNVRYEPGSALMDCVLGDIKLEMQMCISPEDGTLVKKITIENKSGIAETVSVADCVPVSLDRPSDAMAHPVFRHLFVRSDRFSRCAVRLKRRARSDEECLPSLMHLVSTPGSVKCETDMEKLTGRMGSAMRPDGIVWEMRDTVGDVHNPCSALCTTVTIQPEKRVELHFAMGLVKAGDERIWAERCFAESMPERALQLSRMQSQAMLGFIGLDARHAHLLSRLSVFLFDRRLSSQSCRDAADAVNLETLWSMGISGDLPLIVIRVARTEETRAIRDVIRAHEYYSALGLVIDLAILNAQGSGYEQPVRDVVSEMISCSHLNVRRNAPGGVYVINDHSLNKRQKDVLERAAAFSADASLDFYAQVRRSLSRLDGRRTQPSNMRMGENKLPPIQVVSANGFGAFLADGRYAIDVTPERTTPAPWANMMANESFGVLLTERGGGFLWCENSRSGRLTAFENDALSEGWGWMLYLVDDETKEFVKLLPGKRPQMAFRVLYSAAETVYRFETERISGETAMCVRTDADELRIRTVLRSTKEGNYRIVGFVDWMMGTSTEDAGIVRTWTHDGACFAAGAMNRTGYFAASSARVRAGGERMSFLGCGDIQNPGGLAGGLDRTGGWVLSVPVRLRVDVPMRLDWAIGAAMDAKQAHDSVRAFYAQSEYEKARESSQTEWKHRNEQLRIETPDKNVNVLGNGWLLHQTLSGRVRSRTGLYQPGGAYGFRDQLQDMLALLAFEPQRVRAHILGCAARQFEDGDVMHWWHEPFLGVRTHISDDMLFLPWVTAEYVRWTQDQSILNEQIVYLENVDIEEGKEDRFCEMRPGMVVESLHEHCMRAFKRADAVGVHGLALMGSGDWNDGMNHVGNKGQGESIWLTEFLAACAENYSEIAPEKDAVLLRSLAARMKAAVESEGWDGNWYLRAYSDDGTPMGTSSATECRIDAISQAWAVLSGLDKARCLKAMDAAWNMLVDENKGIVRLLTPPFSGEKLKPGYIASYPCGVRENGAQYTHAACWLLLALIRMGDAGRAHRMLQMLLPMNHADTPENAERYRVEPYVVAADLYDGEHAGRGGWTWYTGSAAWLYQCILELLGFKRRGENVQICALLGDWEEASVTVKCGKAEYRLISRKGVQHITLDGTPVEDEWIAMIDDGCKHEALFPCRKESK